MICLSVHTSVSNKRVKRTIFGRRRVPMREPYQTEITEDHYDRRVILKSPTESADMDTKRGAFESFRSPLRLFLSRILPIGCGCYFLLISFLCRFLAFGERSDEHEKKARSEGGLPPTLRRHSSDDFTAERPTVALGSIEKALKSRS
jgi:hypothetical protein